MEYNISPLGEQKRIALAELIRRLAIAWLHVLGDVYNRGPGAHLIMDTLIDYYNVDILWDNHDIFVEISH